MSVPHKIYNLILRLVNVNKAVMKNSYLISVSHKTYFPITRPVRVNVTTTGSTTTVPVKIKSRLASKCQNTSQSTKTVHSN